MFRKILIANRGEIALRVLRACREMGIGSVAVHSTADAAAMHVRLADESVCIGPPQASESYLNAVAILAAAEITGADAIHPGYGFLSENPDFVQMVEEHAITFIGPSAEHIRIMGDKARAKAEAKSIGLPVVPGSDGPVASERDAHAIANEIGFPVLVKAVAGGGGRGMTVVHRDDDLHDGLRLARREASAGFGDDRVYLEKYLEQPRHIEIQVVGDSHGNAIHLGERDCSVQRRHQKIIEEAPSPALTQAQREDLGKLAASAVARMGYLGAGTLEFLYEDGQFYFMEMNTRLQVEHPVTEMITGVDLVREQILVAAGEPLTFAQDQIRFDGHAMECRINAEDPVALVPSPGTVGTYHSPGGPGVRVDSALYAGVTVPPYYDSLIAKLVVHAADREQCIQRMRRALGEYVIDGIQTGIPLLLSLLDRPEMTDGSYHTKWLERLLADRNAKA